MNILKFPSAEAADRALQRGDVLLLLISFDGETVLIAPAEEAEEHHILLEKAARAGLIPGDSRDIDRYFRVVADPDGADWTFVCPPDYRGIPDKTRRIAAFYDDGFQAIFDTLKALNLRVGINIPRRYRRHLQFLKEE